MKKNKTDHSNESLFQALSQKYKESTGLNLPELQKYKGGEFIYTEGQVPKGIFYITKGSVKITKNERDKSVVVRLALSHNFIGFVSLLKQWDYQSSAIAIEEVEVYFFAKSTFLNAIHSDPSFANLMVEILCSRINDDAELVVDLITKNVQQRLAILLLTLNHANNTTPAHQDGFIHTSKKDIASILSIQAETLSRTLAGFSKLGIIKLHGQTNIIELLSKEKLLQISVIQD